MRKNSFELSSLCEILPPSRHRYMIDKPKESLNQGNKSEAQSKSRYEREAQLKDTTLLSIREFSRMAGVQQSALRYYDKIDLFSPVERGENKYRFYTPFQLITLKFINVLADLGIPLNKIKDLNTKRTPERILDLLIRQEIKLDRQMHQLRTAYSIIHMYRDNIQAGLLADEDDIRVEEVDESDEYYIIFGPENDFSDSDTFYKPFVRFCESAGKNRINLNYPIGGYHRDMETYPVIVIEPLRIALHGMVGNKNH